MKRIGLIVAIAAVTGMFGCTNMTPQQQGTMSGAGHRRRGGRRHRGDRRR